MKISIITEGGKNIGFGHIARCVALSQAFKEKGISPQFIINGDSTIKHLLKEDRYKIFNWIKEKDMLLSTLNNKDTVVIDSYLAPLNLYRQIQKKSGLTVYIDDNRRLDYPAGIVVNGMIYAKSLGYPKKEHMKYLIGSRFALLRKEFRNAPKVKIRQKIKSVLIMFGGSDIGEMTLKILKFLVREYPSIKKNIVTSKAWQAISRANAARDNMTNLISSPDAEMLKNIMLDSDIAISAGGQTLHELAKVGIPTIGICVAENQINNIKGWEKAGFLEYVGWYDEDNLLYKLAKVIKYLENQSIRITKADASKKYIDGKGSLRIVEAISNL